ncbi:MAG: flagellar motor protein [Erythrobacter sp.]|nr:flagellar motor protein [Erythrobacter sp.]
MASQPVQEVVEAPRPIIVKKVTIVEGGHHGGAWKVAYADFVTAMMAFFLLLWLLNATTEEQKQGLADYFTPTLVQMSDRSAGGTNLLKGTSVSDREEMPTAKSSVIKATATGSVSARELSTRRSSATKQAIEQILQSTPRLRELAQQVRLVDTTEGVRIDLVDDADFSMFKLGTTVLTNDARELLSAISDAASRSDTLMTLRGHTDALPWREGVIGNNWSLSAGRAEATRMELMRNGIDKTRFTRIEGVADREPLIADNPNDPRNRRISITVLD